jgi:hypothetical protein
MAVELYTCDPNGDLLLIMSRHVVSDSESETDTASLGAHDIVQPVSEDDVMGSGPDGNLVGDNLEADGDVSSLGGESWETESSTVDCHFLISSKHMILASSVFKAMLQGDFSEGLKLRATGELELPLPDDDPDAFVILLNIIHGHNRKVPRLVDLSLLIRIAILVDKYQMLERVEIFSDMWIDELQGSKNGIPKSLTPDVLSWLSISWVFNKADPFRQLTRILAMEGDDDMGGEKLQVLPIPDRVISMNTLKSCHCSLINTF